MKPKTDSISLSGAGARYLVINHNPFSDPTKPITATFADQKRAVNYAGKLNSIRVDVIDAVENKYVVRYPLYEYENKISK